MRHMGDNTLRELVYGKGAHVDPVACVEDISAELAARTVAGYPHSVWQIVGHMNYWMEYDLSKIDGESRHYPDHAIESWPAVPRANETGAIGQEWKATTRRFTDLLGRLARLAESDAASLERTIQNVGSPKAPREATVRAMLYQLAAHNTYHTGQIALLRRQAGAWPPERGGDTW
ncbi:MAG TPA: DinB family protein [Terriglobales bacterium]|nr:DinB family protein [Terriglobales bacterium]